MNYTVEGLLKEAAKLESGAKTLREAAALISGMGILTDRKTTKRQLRKRVDPQALVEILKERKEMQIFEIVNILGVAKPTIYSWIKKTGLFENNGGAVTIKVTPVEHPQASH
jgi:hypothetical protein